MTKFEGTTYRPKSESPGYFTSFLEHYALVVRFLTAFNENRFRFDTDVRSQLLDVVLLHNQPVTIRHTLGYPPTEVSFRGRVGMFTVTTRSADTVTVTAKLLTTPLAIPIKNQLILQMTVMDPTLFVRGDRVDIGGNVRRIAEIQGNLITLDASCYVESAYVLSLAAEPSKALIY